LYRTATQTSYPPLSLHREAAPAAGVPKPQLKISASEEFDDLIAGPAKPRPGTEKRKLQGLIPERMCYFFPPPPTLSPLFYILYHCACMQYSK
jgi:hypothetical protein